MISVLIGSINSIIGIGAGQGIKINATDIFLTMAFIYEFIINRKKIYIFNPIKWIILIFFLMSSTMIWGAMNGGELGSMIRILRNIVYIILMFLIVNSSYRKKNEINIYKSIIVFCWVAIINCLINVAISFYRYNWFINYRENATFQVFMFIFLLLYKDDNNDRLNRRLLRNITIIFLGICILLSQERLQILAVMISLLIRSIVYSINILNKKGISIRLSLKHIVYKLIMLGLCVFLLVLILRNDYIKNYIDYFIKYRVGSIFSSNGFKSDASLDGRALQVVNILNRNYIYYLFGSGLSSLYMSTTGLIHIVDGMWLWIFKDLGIVGIVILFIIYISIIREVSKVNINKLSIAFGLIAILILQIFTPNIMLGISDSVFIGYILSIIYLYRKKDLPNKEKIYLD